MEGKKGERKALEVEQMDKQGDIEKMTTTIHFYFKNLLKNSFTIINLKTQNVNYLEICKLTQCIHCKFKNLINLKSHSVMSDSL